MFLLIVSWRESEFACKNPSHLLLMYLSMHHSAFVVYLYEDYLSGVLSSKRGSVSVLCDPSLIP